MLNEERTAYIDAVDEASAIQQACELLSVKPERIFVKSRKRIASGLIKFELVVHKDEVSIDELLSRVDIQLNDIDTSQFLKGYTSDELKEKGLLDIPEGSERNERKFATTIGAFEIPEGIDFCECERMEPQDYGWLISVQRVTPCRSGATVAVLHDANIEKGKNACGSISFVPPLETDSTMILPKTNGKTVEFVACLPGRVLVYDKKLYLLPIDIPGQIGQFNVSNSMKGICSFIPAFGNGKYLTLPLVRTFLSYKGIRFGIQDGTIEKALEACTNKKEEINNVVFAKGMPQIDGRDGVFQKTIQDHLQLEEFQIGEDGKIDYHRKLTVPSVNANEQIAKISLPTTGQPGMDIFGNMVLAQSGRPLTMSAGEGVYTSPDGREFYAARVGQVNFGPDSIQVVPVYQVDGDVDAHTGNIEFDGNILILGSIQKGFRVKAKGNVEVRGDIQCGMVEAGRDLTVKGGFVGDNNTCTKVGRNLVARHLMNCIVEVEGDVHILTSCINSIVETTGQFYCIEGKGALVGGTILALRGGRAKEVGNESAVKTQVICGQDFSVRKKIREAQHIQKLLQEDIQKMDIYLKPVLQRVRDFGDNMSADQKGKVVALISHRKDLSRNVDILAKRISRLEESALSPESVKFWVYEHVFLGTHVQICNASWMAEREAGRVTFSIDPKTHKIRTTN